MIRLDERRRRRAAYLTKAAATLAGLAALLAAFGLPSASGQSDARGAVQPNIVVITTDDQTVESLRVMANVNQLLVAEGSTFENSFASFPLCCPWRASFLTGQHSHNNGVVGNSLANGLSRLNEKKTLPVWLRKAGYTTGFVGKYLNGYGARGHSIIPPGWDEWYAGVTLAYYGHTMNRNGKLMRYGYDEASYQTDVYTRTALDVLRRQTRGSKPFFLWLSYFAPHHGGPSELYDPAHVKTAVSAARHRGRFATEALPVSPAFDEPDVSDKPGIIQRRNFLSPEFIAAMTHSYRQRLESLLAVDEGIAQVVAALRRSGQLERTLIVFTSDNGFIQGEHRIVDAKEFVYEASIRVPLIMRGPGVPRGLRLHQPVSNVDLAPTLIELGAARAGITMDGSSLVPLLIDPGVELGRDILLERGPGGSSATGTRLYTALRTPRWKYVEHSTGERELYDLIGDPYELQSLHADPAYAAVVAELSRRLALARDCRGRAACNAGPALKLETPDEGGCVRRARVLGTDTGRITYVQFLVNGSAAAADSAAPFEHVLAPASAPVRVRALAVLDDGRRLTLDAGVRVCA